MRRYSTRSDSSLFVFIIRKTLNQRSLLFRAPIRNRLETALHGSVCKRSWSSTAIAVTNRSFI
jgi:hypothetical protein